VTMAFVMYYADRGRAALLIVFLVSFLFGVFRLRTRQLLFLAVVLGPYRRGEVWAWKALLIAGLTQCVLVLLRIPILGTQLGVSAATTPVVVLVVGLLLDVGRLRGTGSRRTG